MTYSYGHTVISRKVNIMSSNLPFSRCPINNAQHSLNDYRSFRKKHLWNHKKLLREKTQCFRCLSQSHVSKDCTAYTAQGHISDTLINISISITSFQIKQHQDQHQDNKHQDKHCQQAFSHQHSWTYLISIHCIALFAYMYPDFLF